MMFNLYKKGVNLNQNLYVVDQQRGACVGVFWYMLYVIKRQTKYTKYTIAWKYLVGLNNTDLIYYNFVTIAIACKKPLPRWCEPLDISRGIVACTLNWATETLA